MSKLSSPRDHFDILALTETWHSASDDVRLRLATPDDYAVVEAACYPATGAISTSGRTTSGSGLGAPPGFS